MIAIQAVGSRNIRPGEQPDLKAEFKALTNRVNRRADRFITLALIGACQAIAGKKLPAETGVFMTSGQGNLAVFNRICEQKYIEKHLPKPVDFINLLSNSAGFYVASELGFNGRNLFLSHHAFAVQMSLLLARTDLKRGKQKDVLIGGVDEMIEPYSFTRKFLGLGRETVLGEGSNWMLLSDCAAGAIATLEVIPRIMTREEIASSLASCDRHTQAAFGLRFNAEEAEALCDSSRVQRFAYEKECGFYETVPFFAMNHFIQTSAGSLLFIDQFEGRYMVMRVNRRS